MDFSRLDEHERIAFRSPLSCAVLGNAAGDFLLVPLDREGYPLTEGEQMKARLSDMEYCGIFGYAHGFAECQLQPGRLAWHAMNAARPAFLDFLRDRLATPEVDFLEALYRLEDPRQ